MKKNISCLCFLLLAQFSHAQSENADFMRSIGKIYVVVAVLACVFAGIVVYLWNLDRKLTKLENQILKKDE
jgi:CcmD family protein